VSRRLARLLLLVPVLAYTAFSAGPYVWTAMMSLRTTEEIYRSHYGLPIPAHWLKYATAWNEFGYATYFKNSTIVAVISVLIVSVIGSMSGYAFARRRFQFPLREPLFLLIFLSIMFPPQIMLLSLFQILVQYRLFNSLTGLILVYVVTELPLTIYLLRTFFAQIPTELEEAARLDGCGDWAMFWRVMFPMALPAVATTVILNFIYFWNEFLYAVIFITQQKIRTLPLAIQFLVSDQYQDVGMLATGLMIATLPGADPLPVPLRVVREGHDGGRTQRLAASAAEAGGELRELRAVHVGDECVAEPARLPQPHVEAAHVRRERTARRGPGEVVDAAHDEQGDGVEAASVDGRGGAAVEEVLGGAAAQGELGVAREGDDRRKVEAAREPRAKLMHVAAPDVEAPPPGRGAGGDRSPPPRPGGRRRAAVRPRSRRPWRSTSATRPTAASTAARRVRAGTGRARALTSPTRRRAGA
jgi:multiple sugar transport system permease protein/raffinose/stachyose/melibiose transport system permease protein